MPLDNPKTRWLVSRSIGGLLCAAVVAGCVQEMANQPRFEPLEASSLFEDGQSSRPLVPGTVARGHLQIDEAFYKGRENGVLLAAFPARVFDGRTAAAVLERGQQRFKIFCAVCHGQTGAGDGMIVRRGFPHPPAYQIERLRNLPPSHFFDVMTNGLGRMPSYAAQVPPEDRWAIATYIRALQLSQYAPIVDLPDADRARLQQPGN